MPISMPKPPANGVTAVDGGVLGAFDALDGAVPDPDHQIAADAAVRADGAHPPVVGRGLGTVAVA